MCSHQLGRWQERHYETEYGGRGPWTMDKCIRSVRHGRRWPEPSVAPTAFADTDSPPAEFDLVVDLMFSMAARK